MVKNDRKNQTGSSKTMAGEQIELENALLKVFLASRRKGGVKDRSLFAVMYKNVPRIIKHKM